ncbi:M20 family metallopeptidase [Erythrobacter sp. NE805]|uniref:M20 metallopeptidase family protein n=1 Tax=Erythrobacter sp. NE805 TaxID=3389875 RepID=UPI00396B217E
MNEIAWSARAEELLPDLVALRRAIHAEPELGLHNPLTRDKIRAALDGLPLAWRSGPSTTGLIAILEGARPGRTVLLRGDTDALPMPEETGLDFASRFAGVMHACGHDSHAAMLVGACKLLAARREEIAGRVMFMFQPGEEGHHGARFMIEDGLLDPLPDAAFALHVMPNAPHGVLSARAGAMLASSDRFIVEVTGRGGHAAMPHDALDPVPVACEIVLALQTFVARRIPVADPAVLTVGQIVAGTTDNVIADTARLLGTIRTLSPRSRGTMLEALERIAIGIARTHEMDASVTHIEGFPVTMNDPRAVSLAERVVGDMFGHDSWMTMPAANMGAEDFSYVLEKVPGAMIFLGASQHGSDWKSCCALHSTGMVLDESVMARGAALHAAIATRFLEKGFEDQ